MKKLLMIIALMGIAFSMASLDFTGTIEFRNMLTQEEGTFNFESGLFTNRSTGYKSSFNFLGAIDGLEVYRNDYLQIAIVAVENTMLLVVTGEMLNGDVVLWKSYSTEDDEEYGNEEYDNEL